jgi:REP element-mobilizing transposase RayT
MTPPRYIVQNQLAFVTCGAVGRSFRFLPSRGVVELIWYVLAVMIQRYSMQLHEVVFMSNHFHLMLTDRDGVLPDFMRDLNSLLSRGLNALHGSTGANIEKQYNIVVPADGDKVIEHAIYTLLNPCKDGLVERARDWGGVTSYALEYGRSVTLRRPREGLWKSIANAAATLLRKVTGVGRRSAGRLRHAGRTKLPETVELTLVPPAGISEPPDALRRRIRGEVRREENELIAARRAERRGVIGMRRVLSQSYTDTPSTSRVLFRTTPRVSGTRRWARIETLARRLDFERAHASARDAIAELLAQTDRLGRRLAERLAAIELPHGAFLLRRRYGCLRGAAG